MVPHELHDRCSIEKRLGFQVSDAEDCNLATEEGMARAGNLKIFRYIVQPLLKLGIKLEGQAQNIRSGFLLVTTALVEEERLDRLDDGIEQSEVVNEEGDR